MDRQYIVQYRSVDYHFRDLTKVMCKDGEELNTNDHFREVTKMVGIKRF